MKPTNTNPDAVLSDDALRRIETRLKTWTSGGQYPASWDEVNALCATVRALRAENARMDDELDRWRCRRLTCLAHDNVLVSYQYDCPLCAVYTNDAENTALREQLVAETERADSNFTAYDRIKTKYSETVNQLAQVTQENEKLHAIVSAYENQDEEALEEAENL